MQNLDPQEALSAIINMRAERNRQALVAEANALDAMKKTAGWAIVAAFIAAAVEHSRTRLLYETDLNEIRRLQESAKAYANIVAFVDTKIAEASLPVNASPDSGELEDTGDYVP